MYNRYIPQSDGTYQRSRVPDPRAQKTRTPPPKKEPECPEDKTDIPPKVSVPRPQNRAPFQPPRRREEPFPGNISGFLRQILPKDFDTADLLVVVLLLLISADCDEDQNTALLTLALYFFL